MKAGRQTTLADRVHLKGQGVHSGTPVEIILHPAEADTGVVFIRNDTLHGERVVVANHRSVGATELQTVLSDREGPIVSTVEHLMAALAGLGVDNVIVEVDGAEVPILDGSAAPFVAAIDKVGLVSLAAGRRYIKILKPIRVSNGRAFGELLPNPRGFRLEVEIDFDHAMIGQQSYAADVTPAIFRRELARARTFGFMRDVAKLWSMNFALGASLDNTIVVGDDRVLNPEGLRYDNEFVRHKAMDAVGDLSLAGMPILGTYRAFCAGHKVNYAVLAALFADPTAYAIVTEMPRRERAHAELGAFVPAPAFRAQ